jgi:hypothetical protein
MLNRYGWRASGLVALASIAVVAFAGDLRAQGLKVFGYGDLEWSLEQTGDPNDEWHNFFDNHHFNLLFLGWIMDDVQAGAEVEYEHAGDEIELEYGYVAYTGIRNLRLVGGKFIIPFNRFNRDLHPSWINKMPGRPTVYDNVFPSTYSDVGIWVSGGLPTGARARFVFDAYVVNGLKGEPDAFSFRDLLDNDRDKPNDDNKGVGGRLGIELPVGLGIGGSVYTGGYAQDTLSAERLDVTFLGADINYAWRGLDLRGEFVYAKQDLIGAVDADRKGFYAQAAYLSPTAAGPLARLEPVVRYSWVDFDDEAYGGQDGEFDSRELGIGVSYYLASSAALRLAYFFNIEDDAFKKENDKLVGQFSVGF